MRQLKKSECSVLPLVLTGKWYDLIDSGVKREEYREYKRFWSVRICKWFDDAKQSGKEMVVAFSRGYRPATMFFVAPLKLPHTFDESSHPEWGETGKPHYAIELAERVELVDG